VKARLDGGAPGRAPACRSEPPTALVHFLGPRRRQGPELHQRRGRVLFDDESIAPPSCASNMFGIYGEAFGGPASSAGRGLCRAMRSGGALTKRCVRRPTRCPFDEIEKAASDVFNVLLQVLDDGA